MKMRAVKHVMEIVLPSPHPENVWRDVPVLHALDRAIELRKRERSCRNNPRYPVW